MEFYFSDSNLPIDDFLKKTVRESDDGRKFLYLLCFLFLFVIGQVLLMFGFFGE